MDINSALKLIDQIAKSGLTSGSSQSMPQKASKQWISANNDVHKINSSALDAVARKAVEITKGYLSTPYETHGSSKPKESPHSRTGTLRDSIHWRKGVESRQFPGPATNSASDEKRFASKKPADYAWREKIQKQAYTDNSLITPYPAKKNPSIGTRIIQVNPRAVDSSERSRLEYYSFYLESGWWSKGNDGFNDKRPKSEAQGKKIKRKSALKGDKRDGPKWNPPRPYLSRLAWPGVARELEGVYKDYLRKNLPDAFKSLADKATLKVTYNRGLRVPYISDNMS